MKCALSEVDCSVCEHSKGTDCEINVKWQVLRKELKPFKKRLDDMGVIVSSLLRTENKETK